MTIAQRIKQIEELQAIEMPFEVRRLMGKVSIYGDQLSLSDNDLDFGTVKEYQDALGWFVEQLGGTVKWSKAQKEPKK